MNASRWLKCRALRRYIPEGCRYPCAINELRQAKATWVQVCTLIQYSALSILARTTDQGLFTSP